MAEGSYSKPRTQNQTQGGATTARARASTIANTDADQYEHNDGDEYQEDYEDEGEDYYDDDDDDQVSYNGPLGDIVEQAIDDQQ
jgi:hypothetical protein